MGGNLHQAAQVGMFLTLRRDVLHDDGQRSVFAGLGLRSGGSSVGVAVGFGVDSHGGSSFEAVFPVVAVAGDNSAKWLQVLAKKSLATVVFETNQSRAVLAFNDDVANHALMAGDGKCIDQ